MKVQGLVAVAVALLALIAAFLLGAGLFLALAVVVPLVVVAALLFGRVHLKTRRTDRG